MSGYCRGQRDAELLTQPDLALVPEMSVSAMSADFDPGTGLGPRLRVAREARQLSVRELARRIGCSASLISQIERGVSVPSVGVLYSLATELDSSLDHLLFGSDQAQRMELRRAASDSAADSGAVTPGPGLGIRGSGAADQGKSSAPAGGHVSVPGATQ